MTMTDRQDLDDFYNLAYQELRRLAAAVLRGDRASTLSPTTLVNEAWLKLAGSQRLTVNSRLHFKRIAARAMRQVLVEAARRRQAAKRGSGLALVTFDDNIDAAETTPGAVLALDSALDELARLHPRQAETVECRFFAGLNVPETAEVLGVSEATVQRDWRAARAWLAVELRQTG